MDKSLRASFSGPVLLGAILAAEGIRFVMVGSAALRLRGFDLPVGDLDIVVDLDDDNLVLLCEVVGRYALTSSPQRSPSSFLTVDICTTTTIYGRLDVMVRRSQLDGDALTRRGSPVRVAGVDVHVASAADAWALRRRFKTSTDGCYRTNVSARSGLGMVDVAVLEALYETGARAEEHHYKATKLVAAVDEATGLGPDPSYELILDHARPWKTPVVLVEFHGNIGSIDDGPSAPSYVEARLTRIGELVVDAEAERIAPIPIGLIAGNAHRGGTRPSFHPTGIVAALKQIIARPDTPDDELIALVGPPRFPTDCEIDGDLGLLVAGLECPVTLRARIRPIGDSPIRAVIDRLPPGASPFEVLQAIKIKADDADPTDDHPELARFLRSPIREAQNLSARGESRVECTVKQDATFDEMSRFLEPLHLLRSDYFLQLPDPLPVMLRQWVTASDGKDITTSLARLTEAL